MGGRRTAGVDVLRVAKALSARDLHPGLLEVRSQEPVTQVLRTHAAIVRV